MAVVTVASQNTQRLHGVLDKLVVCLSEHSDWNVEKYTRILLLRCDSLSLSDRTDLLEYIYVKFYMHGLGYS